LLADFKLGCCDITISLSMITTNQSRTIIHRLPNVNHIYSNPGNIYDYPATGTPQHKGEQSGQKSDDIELILKLTYPDVAVTYGISMVLQLERQFIGMLMVIFHRMRPPPIC